jgi:hypothetical protein
MPTLLVIHLGTEASDNATTLVCSFIPEMLAIEIFSLGYAGCIFYETSD